MNVEALLIYQEVPLEAGRPWKVLPSKLITFSHGSEAALYIFVLAR